MNMMRASRAIAGLILASTGMGMVADESDGYWPQWRGPTGNGVALVGNPPSSWSEQENVRWKVRVPGEGHATPVVWGDKVFVLTAEAVGGGQAGQSGEATTAAGGRRQGRGNAPTEEYAFKTLCLDLKSGAVRWERVSRREVPHEGRQESNTHASASPITDGEHVIAFFGSHGLFCYDMEGGLVWEKDLGDMRTRNGFGEGATPALHDGVLVVLWDTEDESYVVAFEKVSGREIWRREREERTGWTTPYVQAFGGREQVIINGTGAVRSYDLRSGDLLWQCGGQTANAIPAVVSDGERVYAMSGYRGNMAMAIRLGGEGDLTGTEHVVWSLGRGTPYVPSPVLVDGLLVFCQRNDAMVTCVDALTGEVHYAQERVEGLSGVYASPVAVGDRIFLAAQNGATAVLAKSKVYELRGVNRLDESINASPVVVGDVLLLRGSEHLYCIAED